MSNNASSEYLDKLPIIRGVTTHRDVADFINKLVDKLNSLHKDVTHVENLISLIDNIEVIEGIDGLINERIDDRMDTLDQEIDSKIDTKIIANKPIIEIGRITTTVNPEEIGGSVIVNGNKYTINLVIPESMEELTQEEIINLLDL